jgi:hypothetical protein
MISATQKDGLYAAKHEARLSNIQLLQFITGAGLAARRLQICPDKLSSELVEVAGFFALLRMTMMFDAFG